jgi:phenylacetic acid degradation protein
MPAYEIDGVVPVVHPEAFVHPDAVLVGDVVIGAQAFIGPLASLRGDFGQVVVAAGANVQDGCVVHCFPGRIAHIEEDGHIGHGAVLHGCHIGRGVLVGMNAVVMDDSIVGDYAFVAACSFVKAGSVIPERKLAAGVPAKITRDLTDEELAWKANGTRLYHELATRSRSSLRPVEPLLFDDGTRRRLPIERSAATPLHSYRTTSSDSGEE